MPYQLLAVSKPTVKVNSGTESILWKDDIMWKERDCYRTFEKIQIEMHFFKPLGLELLPLYFIKKNYRFFIKFTQLR